MDAFERALQLATSGDHSSAKSIYEQIINSEFDNSAAWYGLGVVNHAVGDFEASIGAFEKAFLLNKYHAPTAANLAFLFSQRDSNKAATYAKAAIELGLSNEDLLALASLVFEEKEETELVAPMILAKSIPVDTESNNLVQKISRLIENSEYQAAMEIISPALEGDYSTDAMIWYYCGLCLHNLDLREDAIQSLNYSLQLDSDLSLAADLVSEIKTKLSEPEQEFVEFSPVAAEEVRYAEFILDEEETLDISLEDTLVVIQQKAKDYTQDGNHALAIQTWKKIIQEYGSTYDSWLGMSGALEAAGHFEKANQCLQKAEDLKNKATKNSNLDIDVDLIAAAKDARISAAQNTPIDEQSVNVAIEWYNKGLTLLAEDKGEQALNCFDKALSSTPRDERELRVRSYNGRGHALHQLGKYSESILSYHQAISMDPTMVTGRTLYNMGSSYAAMEHFADAIKCFQQALSRELDNEESKLIQTQMNRCSLLLKEQKKSAKLQV